MTKVITVAYINQYDQPDWERAKMQIGEWFATTEQGQWCRDRYVRLAYNIEPDGGMEPHYILELELEFDDHNALLHNIRWPEPYGLINDASTNTLP
jgi:hypothetical protein